MPVSDNPFAGLSPFRLNNPLAGWKPKPVAEVGSDEFPPTGDLSAPPSFDAWVAEQEARRARALDSLPRS